MAETQLLKTSINYDETWTEYRVLKLLKESE